MAIPVKIFQIKSIVHYLLDVALQSILLADFKFQTKDNATKQQYHVNTFPKSGNIIFEYNVRRLILPGHERCLQNLNLTQPGLIRCGQSLAMVRIVHASQNIIRVSLNK